MSVAGHRRPKKETCSNLMTCPRLDPVVHARLNRWSEWVITGRRVKGLGFPSQCSYTKLTPSTNTHIAPHFQEESYETEKVIHRLEKKQIKIIKQFYLHCGTWETHAKALHCSKSTLLKRMDEIHRKILYLLSK